MKEVVCHKDDLKPGEIMEASFGRKSIVVCRSKDGEFYAFLNRCLHQGAPMAKGKLCGAPEPTDNVGEYNFVKDGEILRCPWHGREFDIKNNGCMLAKPKLKLKEFKVSIEEEQVVVSK